MVLHPVTSVLSQKKMIRFSVIIPLYNKAHFIQKTVESILAQSCQEFEIIIVNDGSTDDSLAVVSKINDPRIRIFTKPNGGVSHARNYGIEKAQYEYIAFLDADDLWLPDYLETQKGMIEQYPQAGISATTYTSVDSQGNKHDRVIDSLSRGEVLLVEDYCKYVVEEKIMQIHTAAICVKKELFSQTGGFRVGVKRGEDLDMWLRLSLISPMVWKNEPKIIYNLATENNAMAGYSSKVNFPYKESCPYWEWYSYSSSIYLKIYTDRKIEALLKQSNLLDKIHIVFKINWFFLLEHFVYLIYKSINNKIHGKQNLMLSVKS